MMRIISPRSEIRTNSPRGNALVVLLIVVGVLGVSILVLMNLGFFSFALAETRTTSAATTDAVKRENLVVTVTEDGKLESAKNVDIKCEVAGGNVILFLIPDGTLVEAGEKLVELDSSGLEEQLRSQTGIYEKALAAKIQADEEAGAAAIAVEEYVEGLFKKAVQDCDATITIAEENLSSAENILQHSQRMSRKGFVTDLQVQADKFAVKRAELELESANTAKTVLVKYTKEKTRKDLEGKRDAAEARARSEAASVALEKGRLNKLTSQLTKCLIKAPSPGMVVYYKESSRYGSQNSQIQEGATVREHQTIIQLPDLTKMQARVPIHESKVELVKKGMRANLKVLDKEYQGTVMSVANQPDSKSFFQAQVNDYPAVIQIDGDAAGLRPGYTAEVEILIANLKDVLTIPVAAVVDQDGQHKCWVQTKAGPEERPLVLGMTNDKVVEIKDGLSVDEPVILNPRAIVPAARASDKSPTKSDVDTKKKFGEAKPVTAPSGGLTAEASDEPKRPAGPSIIKLSELDKNSDSKIDKDEASEDMKKPIPFLDNKTRFELADKDGNGFLTQDEADAANKESRERFLKRQQGAGRGGQSTPGIPGGGA